MPVPKANPSAKPICGIAPKRPRRSSGPCSTASSTAPAHSPPSANPCRMRSVSSSTGAQAPICAAVGRTPINAVATPMISIVNARLRLRPIRSPMCPNTSPPIGRMTNPTANVANASSVPTKELCAREEHSVEHQARRGGVQEEVVPLHGGAQQACRHDGAQAPTTFDVRFVVTLAARRRPRRATWSPWPSGPRRPRTASPVPVATVGWDVATDPFARAAAGRPPRTSRPLPGADSPTG